MTIDRLSRLRDAMQARGVATVAIVPGANLRYLAGLDMHMNERLTVAFFPAEGSPAIVLPMLEAPRAQVQARVPLRFYGWDDAAGPYEALRRCAADLGLDGHRVGVEYTAMRVLELRGIEQAAEIQAEDATPILASLRMVKDAGELAAMRTAVRIVEAELRAAIAQVRVGTTERELADIWEREMHLAGGAPAFTTIVASGPNAANPHHSNGDRAFQPGDLIVMDGGVLCDGYASDITRTIALGEPGAVARRIYELVLAANAAGRAACRPGATGEAIDRAARGDRCRRLRAAVPAPHRPRARPGDPRAALHRRRRPRSAGGRHDLHDRAGHLCRRPGRRADRGRRRDHRRWRREPDHL
jgi:Xaa-Pro aminopeptidase